MFLDEARISSVLEHGNIVRVLEVGEAESTLFIAMEYVEGASLAELFAAEDGPLAPGLVAFVGRQVLSALSYAHTCTADGTPLGLVHRDVSPQNILVSTEGAVKLTDFGIALAHGRITKTTAGNVKGKLSYMAPEQGRGDTAQASADVFACAAVLYELFAGHPPYHRGSELEILRAMESPVARPLATACPELPSALSQAIDAALAFTPAERPSAAALSQQLEPFALDAKDARLALGNHAQDAFARRRAQSESRRDFERALMNQALPAPGEAATKQLSPSAPPRQKTRASRALPLLALGLVGGAALVAKLYTPKKTTNTQRVAKAPAPLRTADAAPPDAQLPSVMHIDAGPPTAAPATPEAPPKAAKMGRLTVTSFPWAKVRIDGKAAGHTPLRSVRLAPGAHIIELTNPKTGQKARRRVRITEGKATSLRVEL